MQAGLSTRACLLGNAERLATDWAGVAPQARQVSREPPTAGSRAARHHSPAHESILAIYHQFRHLWRRTPADGAAAQTPEQRALGPALPPPPPLPLWPLDVVPVALVYVNVGSAAAAA